MAKTSPAFGEEEDPSSRYQNPRYSGKPVPDRGSHPKRKVNFYNDEDEFTHSAYVRMVTRRRRYHTQIKPHQGDINKNVKKAGGLENWKIAE